MRAVITLFFLIAGGGAQGETVFAAQTVRVHDIVSAADLVLADREMAGMVQSLDDAIGMEARVTLYAGRPIRINDVGPPAIIERNQIVTLIYQRGGLTIAAEARALGRASVGDRLRVMNLASRSTLVGTVRANGSVTVGGPDLTNFN